MSSKLPDVYYEADLFDPLPPVPVTSVHYPIRSATSPRERTTAYDADCQDWERELLGPGDWRGATTNLRRLTNGELVIPTPQQAEAYVSILNDVELRLLKAQADRNRRHAFLWQIPFWVILAWAGLWLLVAYPLVRFGYF